MKKLINYLKKGNGLTEPLIGLLAFLSGIIGGLFGAGGGGLTYFLVNKTKDSERPSDVFAQTLLITLPSAIVSLGVYFLSKQILFPDFGKIILPCLLGGIAGAFMSKKISNALRIIFSLLLITSGTVSLLKAVGKI